MPWFEFNFYSMQKAIDRPRCRQGDEAMGLPVEFFLSDHQSV